MLQQSLNIQKCRRALTAAVAALGLTMLLTRSAQAQLFQVALTPGNVIGGSGSYPNNLFNIGQYAAGFVFDNQLAVTIPEPDQAFGDLNGGYWLGKDFDFNEFFVVDMVGFVSIDRFEIFNTHNAFFNDRGTRDFQIYGSNQIAALAPGETGAGGFDLANPTLLVNSTLTPYQTLTNDPIEPQSFTPTSNLPYRYLRFNALSQYPTSGSLGVGINELKVFGTIAAVPEPGTVALAFSGLLPIAGVLLRRRKQ